MNEPVFCIQIEVATGRFPYPKWTNVFEQLTQVVKGDAPSLDDDNTRFSPDFINFVNTWYGVFLKTAQRRLHRYKDNEVIGKLFY